MGQGHQCFLNIPRYYNVQTRMMTTEGEKNEETNMKSEKAGTLRGKGGRRVNLISYPGVDRIPSDFGCWLGTYTQGSRVSGKC